MTPPAPKTQSQTDAGGDGPAVAAPALLVRGVCKSYGSLQALKPGNLELAAGEVHALVGENGSGKSTFVGAVSGAVRPDAGTVVIAGETSVRHTPAEAQAHGAITVYQDGSLFPQLTVAQNFYLGTPAGQRPSFKRIAQWTAGVLPDYGLGHIGADVRAGDLSPGERQLVEIVRAIASKPRVLLLDEATSALDAAGVDRALRLIREAAQRGSAVLFVTHRLSEVMRVADRISVLRDGNWVGTTEAAVVTTHQLVERMAGTTVDVEFPDRAGPDVVGGIGLAASTLTGERFGPIDLDVRSGEILGIAGADDNGQRELIEAMAGVGIVSGRLEIGGRSVADHRGAVGSGLVFLSSDRRAESLFPPLAVRENIAVGVLGSLARLGVVSRRRESRMVRDQIAAFTIRTASIEQPVASLSGGNQQKVAISRALAMEPKVLLVDEPTQGVDVRSRIDIYRTLRSNAEKGLAVVVNSSDASELAGLCDRIVVVSRGRIVDEVPGALANEERIVGAFAGAADGPAETESRAAGQSAATVLPDRSLRGRLAGWGRGHQDAVRLLTLAALICLVGAYAQSQNATFLTEPSIYNLLLLVVPLAVMAAAQFTVLFIGGIDISVGATLGVVVAVLSFFVQSQGFLVALVLSFAIAAAVGIVIGATNATLVEGLKISPVIATIATLGILQGVGFVLRPTAAGTISPELTEYLTTSVGAVPWALIVIAAIFIGGDRILRSTGRGLQLRALGLNPRYAHRLGVNATRLRALAYVACAVLASFAGVLVATQVGVGDSTVGTSYTTLAIAAPVIGGASLLGGYGSLVGCMLGSILLVLAQSLTVILGINDAVGFILTGGLMLVALLMYTGDAGTTLKAAARTSRLRILGATRERPQRREQS